MQLELANEATAHLLKSDNHRQHINTKDMTSLVMFDALPKDLR